MKCCDTPTGIEEFAGVTAIDTSDGAVTVKLVEPVTEPESAWIVVVPVVTLVARPAALIVATVVADELHMTELVRFRVLLSV